ncbi:hypothetical protein SAICODRAFT_24006 [Saitoella complicata NRRL Y-17804]|uniref:uncharacterized protein n=1 Tax=Saitoella complicata (strain BCRC 22490 / CBS 7301 / JCM 7358 / NBRC 10748 / NRRL Y-17804) TaxID=698492 RepID=UPI0008676438|nr:uncharacterized protein SAICODRAFT_24006 [Saitoella complicata NRRL Y-17804]ODQ54759.1 hypothetical protein SAICODRAFT_24006 [Saitoella complicata NRRL Y-17804]
MTESQFETFFNLDDLITLPELDAASPASAISPTSTVEDLPTLNASTANGNEDIYQYLMQSNPTPASPFTHNAPAPFSPPSVGGTDNTPLGFGIDPAVINSPPLKVEDSISALPPMFGAAPVPIVQPAVVQPAMTLSPAPATQAQKNAKKAVQKANKGKQIEALPEHALYQSFLKSQAGKEDSVEIEDDAEEMDNDEKLLQSEEGKKLSSKERRQLRNKVSARNFRVRRKEYISHLESLVSDKNAETDSLRAELESVRAENARLQSIIQQAFFPQPKPQYGNAKDPNPALFQLPGKSDGTEWPLAYSNEGSSTPTAFKGGNVNVFGVHVPEFQFSPEMMDKDSGLPVAPRMPSKASMMRESEEGEEEDPARVLMRLLGETEEDLGYEDPMEMKLRSIAPVA